MHTPRMTDDHAPDAVPDTIVPGDFPAVLPPGKGFDAVYGLELIEMAPGGELARGRVRIRDELRQPAGLLHGGVIAAVAETLASWGTWRGAGGDGIAVMGMSNDTSFLRPLIDGHLNSVATPRHRGRTRWQWEVQALDDDGRLCAVTTVNIAIRPLATG
jgi:1,4-dihydroxy-2-naphthoyl-CoA hydrolase